MKQGDTGAAQAAREMLQPAIREEAAALFRAQAESDTPFVERWVQFWANHFTVAGRQQIVASMAGAYEREAIRPHARSEERREGKSVSVRVDLGGRRMIKKKNHIHHNQLCNHSTYHS